MTIHAPACTYSGAYTQEGQVGRVVGSYTCTSGAAGAITFVELHVETSGIIGRYVGSNTACNFDGNIGGVRRK